MSGQWTPAPPPRDELGAETDWTLTPRWLELEQDGFLLTEDDAPVALEEAP